MIDLRDIQIADEKKVRQAKFRVTNCENEIEQLRNQVFERTNEFDKLRQDHFILEDKILDFATLFPDIHTYDSAKKALLHFDHWISEATTLFKDLKSMIEY